MKESLVKKQQLLLVLVAIKLDYALLFYLGNSFNDRIPNKLYYII